MLKKIMMLLMVSLVVTGCQRILQPILNVSETVSDTYTAEQQKTAIKSQAIVKCQELCQQILSNDGQDFEVGPCLSNEIALDWVCDVAHLPRQDVDDDPINQCSAFREGAASHFVEVDGNCNVIKSR